MGGYGAQPAQAQTGQPYGARQATLESQAAVPVAQAPGMPTVPSAPAGGGAPTSPQEQAGRFEAALAAAQRMAPPAPLFGASERPAEPFTAGMPMGPGSGPEVLRNGDRVARTYRQLAEATGNPAFDELAQAAMQMGR
jgi:hypothetical protein